MPPLRASITALVLLTVGLIAACSPGDDCYTCFELGSITVTVRDQSGEPVDGVVVELMTPGGELQATETTPSLFQEPGKAHFLLVAGRDYRVRVTAPSGYRVPSTQSNPVGATARKDRATELAFVLEKI